MARESSPAHPLRTWREQQKLTLEQAAALIESSKTSLSNYENGRKVPRPRVMRNILRVTGGAVTPQDFYAGAAE